MAGFLIHHLKIVKHSLCLLFFFQALSLSFLYSQGNVKEVLLKREAEKHFGMRDYFSAVTMYKDLLEYNPNSLDYNFKYGVSLLYSDSVKSNCLKNLYFAANQSQSPPVTFFFLAKAYQNNYRFDEAIEWFGKYKKGANPKESIYFLPDEQIKACLNAKQFMKVPEEMEIISKQSVSRNFYTSAYELLLLDAKIYALPDEVKSKTDKEKRETLLMCMYNNENAMVYSSYGESDKRGTEIFQRIKFGNGEWSKSQSIGTIINTESDEATPYVVADGNILYFSSKGHNSIGGFDIFRSEWNELTQMWSAPVNMGYPINSPFDDLLFVPTGEPNIAYFASDRNSSLGRMEVFKVRYPKRMVTTAYIKGNFEVLNHPDITKAQITVVDVIKDELIGIYNTNSKNGNYLIAIAPGGKYKYIVKVKGYNEHHLAFELPSLEKLYALRQCIRIEQDSKTETMSVYNFFLEEEAKSLGERPTQNQLDAQKNVIIDEISKDKTVGEGVEVEKIKLEKRVRGKDSDEKTLTEDMKKMNDANSAFKLGDYQSALQIYSQILTSNPFDIQANYKAGLCILHIGKDKSKAIPRLEYAAESTETPEDAFYYLGRAYHLSSKYEKGISAYEKYKNVASKEAIEKNQVDLYIEQCRSGMSASGSTLYEVVNKKSVSSENVYMSFNTYEFYGKLLVTPEDFKSSLDLKKGFKSTMFLAKDNTTIYYSSYGKDGKSGKDIYKRNRLPSGEWSAPQILTGINTPLDEDYPFVTPDGIFYFSSQGFSSIGGYDVFKSEWENSTQNWSKPVNMGTVVNSTSDDIYFIICKDGQTGYFSSNRESQPGHIEIFNFRLAGK